MTLIKVFYNLEKNSWGPIESVKEKEPGWGKYTTALLKSAAERLEMALIVHNSLKNWVFRQWIERKRGSIKVEDIKLKEDVNYNYAHFYVTSYEHKTLVEVTKDKSSYELNFKIDGIDITDAMPRWKMGDDIFYQKDTLDMVPVFLSFSNYVNLCKYLGKFDESLPFQTFREVAIKNWMKIATKSQ